MRIKINSVTTIKTLVSFPHWILNRKPLGKLQMRPRHPNRRAARPRKRRPWLVLSLSLASPLLLLLVSLHLCSAVLRRANSLGRQCRPEPADRPLSSPVKIAMVSFSDEADGGRRSFGGLMETVGGNKRAYAVRMGYDFIDARDLIDPRRPPSWSKIPAVRSHLPDYHWVFWNDADTLVTNAAIRLEHVLRSVIGHEDFHASPDLVVTEDINGINAGVFLVRRSEWSERFLDTWWNQTSFIQFGSTKSGDNDAMKHLINNLLPQEFRLHVRIAPMQCLFNSYPWFPSWKLVYHLISSPMATWRGVYSDGDFMVHLAGLDDKRRWATKILEEIEAVR